jgi:hypothetical protein
MKTTQFHNKNQFLIVSEKEITFQSYESTIAVYDKENETVTLGSKWDFSLTTMKHLYLFISEILPKTNAIKDLISIIQSSYVKNKREEIQKLIDNKIIGYDESL